MERSWCWRPKSRFSDCVQPAILLPLHSRLLPAMRVDLRYANGCKTALALLWANCASERLDQAFIGLRWSFAISWCASGAAWSALIKLLVDSVDENNGDDCRSLATLVNKLMMTASCYKSGRSNDDGGLLQE